MRLPTKENAIAETRTLVSDVIYQATVSLSIGNHTVSSSIWN